MTFEIGSMNDNGGHRFDLKGWPYSIYLTVDYGSVVLCHGIQNLDDAEQLLALCNGTPRPALVPPQMFSWDRYGAPPAVSYDQERADLAHEKALDDLRSDDREP
jgi:hypothetical protein